MTGSGSNDAASPRHRSADTSNHKWRHAFAAAGLAAALGVGTLATMTVFSSASIPVDVEITRGSVASALDMTVTASAHARVEMPRFKAASIDALRIETARDGLRAVKSRHAARFLLAPSPLEADWDVKRFGPSQRSEHETRGFSSFMLASIPDPDRFGTARDDGYDPALSAFVLPDHAYEEAEMAGLDMGEDDETDDQSIAPDYRDDVAAPVIEQRRAKKPATTELAYAAPDDSEEVEQPKALGGFDKLFKRGAMPGRGIAVYDIANAVVVMPNGERLEAHSGRGVMKDNPRYTHVRMRGATPPNVYNLVMRERRFHGIEAIRMLPIDQPRMKGRTGILAHSPLLRGTNGSSGCIAFKNYDKFLAAFKRGEVKKIIVVPDMSHLPTYTAML